ncbi:MAG: grasp-with-spasm system SPASM domain peptide maturase [Crocinitomix sp.]|nr:grasp-with-spasm system SPASM domain peptide maturase [Crocinitomix sp.]
MTGKIKLFSSCVIVKGAGRSTICDFQRQAIKFIPNSLYDILEKHQGKSFQEIVVIYGQNHFDTIKEYFKFLLENEFAFLTKNPEYFPELDKSWESASLITNAIIDLDKNSDHDYFDILEQLSELGCKHLEFRSFDPLSLGEIEDILRHLNTSGICSVDLIIEFSEKYNMNDFEEFIRSYLRVSTISIHSSPNNKAVMRKSEGDPADIFFYKEKIKSSDHCGIISSEYFTVNQEFYLESLNFNSCLNKKISIDVDGNIKNCPSMKESYGKIKDISLKNVLAISKYNDYYLITKDDIDVCKDCEFRYICTDCRAFVENGKYSKPKKCSYSPYSMEWLDE